MSEKDNETDKLEEEMAEQEENVVDAEAGAAAEGDDLQAKLAQAEPIYPILGIKIIFRIMVSAAPATLIIAP